MGSKDLFLDKFGLSEEEFKAAAHKLPAYCFKTAYQNSFILSTNEDAEKLEKRRFELLDEVSSERGL